MSKKRIVIATRESPLALMQARTIQAKLKQLHPALDVTLLGMTTLADQQLDVMLTDIGGKGLFVKELETALYDQRADIAVHSMKDVPMELPAGLVLPVIGEREDPRDALVSNRFSSLTALPAGCRIGTASLRRQTQLLHRRPDLTLKQLRGNINTRLQKLDDDEFDAIILAAAGLKRMDFADRIQEYLEVSISLPSAGQGALGIECRVDDLDTLTLIAPLNHPETNDCVRAERAVCRRLEGGCKVPVAAYAIMEKDEIWLRALVANRDGSTVLRAELKGHRRDADVLGLKVAELLLKQGASAILREFL